LPSEAYPTHVRTRVNGCLRTLPLAAVRCNTNSPGNAGSFRCCSSSQLVWPDFLISVTWVRVPPGPYLICRHFFNSRVTAACRSACEAPAREWDIPTVSVELASFRLEGDTRSHRQRA
jgi:hypothetical protein